ncbi:MAG: MBOAT family protein, partial [Peptostreptococcaceae bacterium]|nr:MBOAT family protein [Peptostreptococcaceae bacterium]
MLFSSYEFLFYFLPITVIGYYLIINTKKVDIARVWLVLASLFFYGWFNIKYLPIIIVSILVNFTIGKGIKKDNKNKKLYFIIGTIFNVGLLCYFKYYDFFVENINIVFKTDWTLK